MSEEKLENPPNLYALNTTVVRRQNASHQIAY